MSVAKSASAPAAGKADPDPGFGYLLHEVARLVQKLADRRFADLGLTRVQFQAMRTIERAQGEISQAELAEALELTPSTVVRLLDRLEAGGWVQRRAHDGDRRAKHLHLTDRSHRIMVEVETRAVDLRNEMMGGLTDEQRRQLMQSLQTVKGTLQRLCGVP